MKCILDIKWGNCSYGCSFCHKLDGSDKDISITRDTKIFLQLQEYIQKIISKTTITYFHIGAGLEPMTFPYFKDLLYYIHSLWDFNIGLSTNGEMIAKWDDLQFLIDTNVREISLPIYGTKEIHNSITGNPEAWEFLQKALEKLKELDIKYSLHCIVLKENMHCIQELDALYPDINYIFPFKTNTFYKNIVPNISLLDTYCKKKISNLFIPCLWVWEKKRYLLQGEKMNFSIRVSSYEWVSSDRISKQKGMVYLPLCQSCKFYKKDCSWFFKDYIDVYHDSFVQPYT